MICFRKYVVITLRHSTEVSMGIMGSKVASYVHGHVADPLPNLYARRRVWCPLVVHRVSSSSGI